MTGFNKKILLLLLSLVWGHVYGGSMASNLYRYTNDEGIVVIDDKVPPHYVSRGYDILSKSGQLLDTVAPVDPKASKQLLTKKELAARQREDRYILISYSSVAEIKAAMARKLEQLDREINVIKINLRGTKDRIEYEQQRAANYQRGGRKVPDNVATALTKLEAEVKKAGGLLAVRDKEYRQTEALYQSYLVRYRELRGFRTKK